MLSYWILCSSFGELLTNLWTRATTSFMTSICTISTIYWIWYNCAKICEDWNKWLIQLYILLFRCVLAGTDSVPVEGCRGVKRPPNRRLSWSRQYVCGSFLHVCFWRTNWPRWKIHIHSVCFWPSQSVWPKFRGLYLNWLWPELF